MHRPPVSLVQWLTNLYLRPRPEISSLNDVRRLAWGRRASREARIRAGCQAVYIGENEVLCRALGRYKMLLSSRDIGFGSHIMLDGFWEMWLTEFIVRRVKPGMRVLDIGANFGYYTLLMSDLVGPHGACFAVEPNPVVAEMLRASVSLNGFSRRTRILAQALGCGEQAEVLFCIPPREPKNARVVHSAAEAGELPVISVASTSVDALAGELGPLDFVKIDAEGAEHEIITGMEKTLRSRAPDMVLEFNPVRGSDPAGLLKTLASVYDELRVIELDGYARGIMASELLEDRSGEDQLLFLSKRH